MTKLIVDEYLNAGGKLTVALRRSLVESPRYVLSREEATELRDELTRALGVADESDAERDAPEPECPFHAAGNEGRCRHCEDQ